MRLNGIDHITGITSDGQRCLDFYAGILGLAFLGRDPDFESPDSHLIRLGHQQGRPDEALAFIEAPGVGRGRAGNGMVHSLRWSVRSPAALDYWAERLSEAGIEIRSPRGRPGAQSSVSRIRRVSSTSSASRRRRRTPASRSPPAPSRTSTRSCGSPG